MTAVSDRDRRLVDPVEREFVDLAEGLSFRSLPEEVREMALIRFVDTLGGVYASLGSTATTTATALALETFRSDQATLVATSEKTTVDMAAFVNATAARQAETNDVYHRPGKPGNHPSDVVLPLLSVAEFAHSSGEDLLTAIVLGYEVCLRLADATAFTSFDYTTLIAASVAVASAGLLGLRGDDIGSAFAIAVTSSNSLRRSRMGELSMWKVMASGAAARNGVFAALLAQAGAEGPPKPVTGRAGWAEGVVGHMVQLPELGTSFKIGDSVLKHRAACGSAIASILAAEKVAEQLPSGAEIRRVLVETYGDAKMKLASAAHHWSPTSAEEADHSIPYVVAATLVDGTVGPEQFDEAHLANPLIRRLTECCEVQENLGFTALYSKAPYPHRTTVTVWLADGSTVVGETGGEFGDMTDPMDRAAVTTKFLSLVRPVVRDDDRVNQILDVAWGIASADDIAEAVPLLSIR